MVSSSIEIAPHRVTDRGLSRTRGRRRTMVSYHNCIECGVSLDGKRGTRGARRFCDKSCAQSHRNRTRAARFATPPPPEPGVRFVPLTQGKFAKVDETVFSDVLQWNW